MAEFASAGIALATCGLDVAKSTLNKALQLAKRSCTLRINSYTTDLSKPEACFNIISLKGTTKTKYACSVLSHDKERNCFVLNILFTNDNDAHLIPDSIRVIMCWNIDKDNAIVLVINIPLFGKNIIKLKTYPSGNIPEVFKRNTFESNKFDKIVNEDDSWIIIPIAILGNEQILTDKYVISTAISDTRTQNCSCTISILNSSIRPLPLKDTKFTVTWNKSITVVKNNTKIIAKESCGIISIKSDAAEPLLKANLKCENAIICVSIDRFYVYILLKVVSQSILDGNPGASAFLTCTETELFTDDFANWEEKIMHLFLNQDEYTCKVIKISSKSTENTTSIDYNWLNINARLGLGEINDEFELTLSIELDKTNFGDKLQAYYLYNCKANGLLSYDINLRSVGVLSKEVVGEKYNAITWRILPTDSPFQVYLKPYFEDSLYLSTDRVKPQVITTNNVNGVVLLSNDNKSIIELKFIENGRWLISCNNYCIGQWHIVPSTSEKKSIQPFSINFMPNLTSRHEFRIISYRRTNGIKAFLSYSQSKDKLEISNINEDVSIWKIEISVKQSLDMGHKCNIYTLTDGGDGKYYLNPEKQSRHNNTLIDLYLKFIYPFWRINIQNNKYLWRDVQSDEIKLNEESIEVNSLGTEWIFLNISERDITNVNWSLEEQ